MGEAPLVLIRAFWPLHDLGDHWPVDGLRRELRVVTPPAWGTSLDLTFVRDKHLRTANGSDEDEFIDSAIRTSERMAEKTTRRSHLPQTLALVLDRFPYGFAGIRLPRPPVVSIVSIVYVALDGTETTLDASAYALRVTGRDSNVEGLVVPVYNTCWPQARCEVGAVVVTYDTGYVDAASPSQAEIPEDIQQGQLLVIGELYKQRSESVHAHNQASALIRARDLWLLHRVF